MVVQVLENYVYVYLFNSSVYIKTVGGGGRPSAQATNRPLLRHSEFQPEASDQMHAEGGWLKP